MGDSVRFAGGSRAGWWWLLREVRSMGDSVRFAGTVGEMDEVVVLQEGPEDFRVLLGGGQQVAATLSHETRRGLGAHGVAPVTVATEMVRFLLERDDLPLDHDGPVPLGPAVGRHPAAVDELRSRLS